jgi:hypothetical protein
MSRLKQIEGIKVSTLYSGNMYFYRYLAQPTNILFDMYPLIFMIRKRGMLWEGINFHYIPVKYRMPLFEDMKMYFDDDELQEDTRLRVRAFRYLILSSRKYRFAKIALHRYVQSGIRSKVLKIPATEWENAIMEPAQRFVTGNLQVLNTKVVHRQSLIKSLKITSTK